MTDFSPVAANQANFFQRHWLALLFVTLLAVAASSLLLAPRVRNITGPGGVLGRQEQQPEPPPPSDVVPEAPGPDNTNTTLPPQPGVPPQPPSPIDSETDPSKKPKGDL